MEEVWDCYGTRSEPLPRMEWWKTFEIATALGRNHYQGWNGGKRLRLLRPSVGTTTKHGIVENVWDCYGTRSEPLPSIEWWKTFETTTALGWNHYQARWQEVETTTALDLEFLWGCDGLTAKPPSHRLGMDQNDVWFLYIVRRLDGFKKNVYILRILQIWRRGTCWQMGPDGWKGQMVEVGRIRSGMYPHSIC